MIETFNLFSWILMLGQMVSNKGQQIDGTFRLTDFSDAAAVSSILTSDTMTLFTDGSLSCADPQHVSWNAPLDGSPSPPGRRGFLINMNNQGATCKSNASVATGHISSIASYSFGDFEIYARVAHSPSGGAPPSNAFTCFSTFVGTTTGLQHNELAWCWKPLTPTTIGVSYWVGAAVDNDAMHQNLITVNFDPAQTYHTYTMRWRSIGIQWLIDGVVVATNGVKGNQYPWEPMGIRVILRPLGSSSSPTVYLGDAVVSVGMLAYTVAPDPDTFATFSPSPAPSALPSSSAPTPMPSVRPSPSPSMQSSQSSVPSVQPTQMSSGRPSFSPSMQSQSALPSTLPTTAPSFQPTALDTISPTQPPSARPSTSPSLQPTAAPSAVATPSPTVPPSPLPSPPPSPSPTPGPTTVPGVPTALPTARPTAPTPQPSPLPSARPSSRPTAPPSPAPSNPPTLPPSAQPSLSPSAAQTLAPSAVSSPPPSFRSTRRPTALPTLAPSSAPLSSAPTVLPTTRPSAVRTNVPSAPPAVAGLPSAAPTAVPSSAVAPSTGRGGTNSTSNTNSQGGGTGQPSSMAIGTLACIVGGALIVIMVLSFIFLRMCRKKAPEGQQDQHTILRRSQDLELSRGQSYSPNVGMLSPLRRDSVKITPRLGGKATNLSSAPTSTRLSFSDATPNELSVYRSSYGEGQHSDPVINPLGHRRL